MKYIIKDKNNNIINTIIAKEDFIKKYCERTGYLYELKDTHIPEKYNLYIGDSLLNIQQLVVQQQYEIEMLKLGITEE